MSYDGQVLLPTLIGSLLSCIASTVVLLCYIIYADQQRSFRHALVLNLALAEFVNSLNNSISGIDVLIRREMLTPGPACTLNGWVGQWSVQAADFSILAIAIITLLTITRKTYMPDASLIKKILICASVWAVPTITASTAAILNQLQPVSGNWCWISGKRTDLRYALGHGWRFCIVLVTIGIYVYIWIYMRRHFKTLNLAISARSYNHSSAQRREFRRDDAYELRSESQTELHNNKINVEYLFEIKHSEQDHVGTPMSPTASSEAGKSPGPRKTHFVVSEEGPYPNGTTGNNLDVPSSLSSPMSPAFPHSPSFPLQATHAIETPGAKHSGSGNQPPRQNRNVEREIKKMLLLNAYPMLYIILWTPGILNRLVEATGHKSRVLTILQCTTQFVGLANAITYGFNEHLRRSVRTDVAKWFKARGR